VEVRPGPGWGQQAWAGGRGPWPPSHLAAAAALRAAGQQPPQDQQDHQQGDRARQDHLTLALA
jgi:hypothetical protein